VEKLMAVTRVLKFRINVDGVDDESLHLTAFDIDEELSVGCRGRVRVDVPQELDPAELIGKKAAVTVKLADENNERTFSGIVLAAQTKWAGRDHVQLELEVGSRIELLKIGQNCRIFQKKSVPDVVKEILEEVDLKGPAQSWSLSASYPKREFISQLNESDFQFVARLLASEGIAFAVRNDDKDCILFFDDASALAPVAEDSTLVDRSGDLPENTVLGLSECNAAAPDAVMLRDYDFKRPAFDLSEQKKADKATGHEVYLHPGGFLEKSAGTRLAQRALERLRALTRVRRGESDNPFFEPGRTFTLQSHPRTELNADHLLLRVIHRGRSKWGGAMGSEEAYANEFWAIPKGVPFRPAPEAVPQPTGVQVAFVTGAPGQELHGNEHGQVKVRFPWDRSGVKDDRSSTWLRVGQMALGGSMIVPRVGFEVAVDHELGDLDRPFVVGHLYNGEAPPPYALPGGATKSSLQTATTGGGSGANELRFDDAAGSEEIFVNASKDYTCSAENDASISVQTDNSEKTGSNSQFHVGANHTATVVGNRSLQVGANQKIDVAADLSDAVGAASSVNVGATRKLKVGGDLTENTQSTLSRTVGALQSVTGVAGYQRKVVGQSRTTAGAWMEAAAQSRASQCGGARLETIGGLKLVKAKTAAVDCGAAHVVNAGTERVSVGGNRTDNAGTALLINAGGGLSIKADNINITAESKIVLRVGGSSLELTPSTITLKSSTIDLGKVNRIGSRDHTSD
jgi:type VI secretion system secreted protein VgrG